MVVACPYCEAEVEAEEETPVARCPECENDFPLPAKSEVTCPGCGSELAVPAGAQIVLCGTCRERVDVASGTPATPASTGILDADEDESAGAHEETSIIGTRDDFEEVRLKSVQEEFAERYEVLEPIGHGGMGAVFKARQRQPERLVVLKVMLSGRFASKKYRKRFEREAQAVARLKHPNIVSVYEYGEANGQPYFTMEYVEGCDVREYVLRHKLDKHEICQLMHQICKAVAYAHQRGVVHRDIKPSNILVDGQGRPRLLDFGLARLADGNWDEEAEMSEEGEVMGTPSYMSPEQTVGRPDEIDLRSDVYSIGVLFYELLTGSLPYRIDRTRPLESLRIVRDYIPKQPSSVNPKLGADLDSIVMKCLEKEREMRYQSAIELAEDINRYLTGKPVEARPSTSFYHLRKLMWRHRGLFLPVSAAILILLVLNVVFIAELIKSQRRAHEQYERTMEKDRRILAFVKDLNAVKNTVDELLVQGRWREAYDTAQFAETNLQEAGYDGYADQVRQRIAARLTGEFDRVGKLVQELKFKEAREKVRSLKSLATHLNLEDLQRRARQASDNFAEACFDSVMTYMAREHRSTRPLEKFLAACPDTPQEEYVRGLLRNIRKSIQFDEWPFGPQEAARRRGRTAEVLEAEEFNALALDEEVELPLALIPAGEFTMGAPDTGGTADSAPAHRVRISTPFYASTTEVTCAQFEAVTGRLPAAATEQAKAAPGRMPANVSWQEAQEFCAKLSKREGVTVRLPTEAEWEYLCRAGSDDSFTSGVGPDGAGLMEYAWYAANSGGRPRAVGQKSANPFGMHDVHGNMREWCADWYDSRYYLASPVEDPTGPGSGVYKVLRGGSWRSSQEELSCVVRTAAKPDTVRASFGFRVCVDAFEEPGEGSNGKALAAADLP